MNKKIEFLDFVRVIATVSVFASHIIFLFWTNNAVVQDLWQTPAVSYTSEWFSKLCHYFRGINFGQFGVALFFLISGFTFLPSAEKSVKPFWLKKFIRIYPVYWGGGVCTTMIWSYSLCAQDGLKYSLKDIFVTATLFRPFWKGVPSVDGISWYLECLMLFYVLAYFFNKIFPLKEFENIILLSTILLIFKTPFVYFSILFILIGVGFYNFFSGNFSKKQCIIATALGAFAYYYRYSRFTPNGFKPVFYQYMYALALFWLFYMLRNKTFIKKLDSLKIVKLISMLSYPIYVVHGACGYVIMANLYQVYPNWFVCVGAATAWTLVAAALLHLLIEKPCAALSKRSD